MAKKKAKKTAKKKVAKKKTKTPEPQTKPEIPQTPIIETPPEPTGEPSVIMDSLVNTVDPARLERAKKLKISVPPNVSAQGLEALIKLAEREADIPAGAEIEQMAVTLQNKKGFFVRVDKHKAVRLLEGSKENTRGQQLWESIIVVNPAGAPNIFVKKEKGYTAIRIKIGGKAGPIVQTIELADLGKENK